MRNVSNKKIETRILCSIIAFSPQILAVYELMWKKHGTVRQATDHNIIRRMRFICWLRLQIHSQNMLILIALPPQQRLRERASLLPFAYIASCFSIQQRPQKLS